MMRNMPLGQILKAQGIITEAQLRDAIRIKQEEGSNKKLGDILIDLKYITENDLIKALSQKARNSNIGFWNSKYSRSYN